MPRALRENGATAVSIMAAIASALMLLSRVILEVKLFALLLLWASMYPLQRALVGKRRTSAHWSVQYTAYAAYYLPAPIAFSAASALYYYTSHVHESVLSLYVFCIATMLVITASQAGVGFTNVRAYSLRERPGDRYSSLKWLLFLMGALCSSMGRSLNRGSSLDMDIIIFMGASFSTAFYVMFLNKVDSTLDCETKAVADYMKQLRKSSMSSTGSPSTSTSTSPFFDDDDDANSSVQLDYCRYPFMEREDGKWVTLKELFHQYGELPTRDKDICLSYSLCRLLARRRYGFDCAEEGDDMVRLFALADLERRDGYKRAFTIVEVQLAFLHDYFFTASLPFIINSCNGVPMFPSIWVPLIYSAIHPLVTLYKVQDDRLVRTIKSLVMVPPMYMLLCLIIGMPMSLLVRVRNLLASYWRPIHTDFHKIKGSRPSTRGLIRDPFQAQTDGAYWRNKIGQYSILHDYDRSISLKKKLEDDFNRAILSQPSYGFIKHLPVEEEEVDMKKLDSVKELVAHTLRAIDGPPTNGTRSLKINMGSSGYDWSWTCRQETRTHTILIWHIATCYCGMTPPHSYRHNSRRLVEIDTWYEVATALSRYCAYLVAFLPEFLPEHSLTTKQVFQRVLQEAKSALGTRPMKEEEKPTKIRGLQLPEQHEQRTTFHKGVELGRQLDMLDTHLRWKVMAEFWAETILYMAPSNNAEVHIEHLAKGGEFITHLWAMLSNAGILKRAEGEWHPPPFVTATEEEPPTQHQLQEAMFSSNDGPSTSSRPSPPIQTSEPPPNEKGKQPQITEDMD